MKIIRSFFDGFVHVLQPEPFADKRGYFMESWRDETLSKALGMDLHFVQDNESCSANGVLRGLHYQWDPPQGKLVRCTRGKILDVVVDLRPSAVTFGQSETVILSAENKHQLWVPPGFGHGFLSLMDDSMVLYKCTAHWSPDGESGIHPLDPTLKVDWPYPLSQIILSPKDAHAQTLADYQANPAFD
tara:strand:- start:1466 stop:2026 length:561 start_codon:yes stop_codon:yes gene_type:complete